MSDVDLRRDLLVVLSNAPENGVPIAELQEELLDPDLLQICDADGLIEFGCRQHYFDRQNRPILERGWEFTSISGPDRKPMAAFLEEALSPEVPEAIRYHIRLTKKGHVEASRPHIAVMATKVKSPPTEEIEWPS